MNIEPIVEKKPRKIKVIRTKIGAIGSEKQRELQRTMMEDNNIRNILGILSDYVNHRVCWLLQDLGRDEGFDQEKRDYVRSNVTKHFDTIMTSDRGGLRSHLLKIQKTLQEKGRFSKIDNPSDRGLVSLLIQKILFSMGILGVTHNASTGRRELRVIEYKNR